MRHERFWNGRDRRTLTVWDGGQGMGGMTDYLYISYARVLTLHPIGFGFEFKAMALERTSICS